MNMKKFKSVIILFAAIIIIGQFMIIDYDDLAWPNNAGSYLGILSMIFVIMAMLFSNRYDS